MLKENELEIRQFHDWKPVREEVLVRIDFPLAQVKPRYSENFRGIFTLLLSFKVEKHTSPNAVPSFPIDFPWKIVPSANKMSAFFLCLYFMCNIYEIPVFAGTWFYKIPKKKDKLRKSILYIY